MKFEGKQYGWAGTYVDEANLKQVDPFPEQDPQELHNVAWDKMDDVRSKYRENKKGPNM